MNVAGVSGKTSELGFTRNALAQTYRQPKGGANDGRAAKAAVHRLGGPIVRTALGSKQISGVLSYD